MDREKVIKALECCLKESDHLYSNPCKDCPYEWKECIDRMKADALTLLKEHENKKLIDADKLIEKLGFAEHCEDCKRDSWKCGCETIYTLYDFCTAIDIAIEELMQEGR